MIQTNASVCTSKFHVQNVVDAQLFMENLIVPKDLWKFFYKEDYPKLEEVAVHLLTMGVQTADAECCVLYMR